MIAQSFPSLRVKKHSYIPVVVLPPKQHGVVEIGPFKPTVRDMNLADKRKITPEEVMRRDSIIRDMWCEVVKDKYSVGDVVQPRVNSSRLKYGDKLKIMEIYKSYHDVSIHEDWPKDDIPLNITLKIKDGSLLLCTKDFFMKVPNGGTC
jgi:hypothetical protein